MDDDVVVGGGLEYMRMEPAILLFAIFGLQRAGGSQFPTDRRIGSATSLVLVQLL